MNNVKEFEKFKVQLTSEEKKIVIKSMRSMSVFLRLEINLK